MPNSVLLVAFKGTIAEHVARKVGACDFLLVQSSLDGINAFLRTMPTNYRYIVGLGLHTGRDRANLRVESRARNKFRNLPIGSKGAYLLGSFIEPGPGIKPADGIGNSWCNLLSYKIMAKNMPGEYAFVHIPKGFNVAYAAEILRPKLSKLL